MKAREKSIDPDSGERPRKYPDENKWIWDLIESKMPLILIYLRYEGGDD